MLFEFNLSVKISYINTIKIIYKICFTMDDLLDNLPSKLCYIILDNLNKISKYNMKLNLTLYKYL